MTDSVSRPADLDLDTVAVRDATSILVSEFVRVRMVSLLASAERLRYLHIVYASGTGQGGFVIESGLLRVCADKRISVAILLVLSPADELG